MIVFVLGPTASGKTKISIDLAKKLNGEIIGADSVQIYRDLVIGSAAPTQEEMEGIPHHLIGTHELNEEISAGKYCEIAHNAINQVKSAGKTPIIVGGTNFYVDALINGLSPIPEIPENEKKSIRNELDRFTTPELFSKLMDIDPQWAGQISSENDIQRIKRGLEVFISTGKKISEWNTLENEKKLNEEFIAVAIDIERSELYEKINNRSSRMVESGIVDEVKKINIAGFDTSNCRALNSIGYAETADYVNGKISSIEELIESISLNTRHLAKRQVTWLKKRNYVKWKESCGFINSVLEMFQNKVQSVSKI